MDSTATTTDNIATSSGNVVFIAFQDQDNLGVGYLASTLMNSGYVPFIVDFRFGQEEIFEHIRLRQPLLVGFSIIFQYHIHAFGKLLRYLRQNGVTCHFTAGGHYPSLRWNQLMGIIPELDSVVLFEGEHTLTDLVNALAHKKPWESIRGIATRSNGQLVANALRPLEEDIDNFSPPLRPPLRELIPGYKYATLLASRGCRYNCVFCSIRQFYSQSPGQVKRLRRPDFVVEEMAQLHKEMGCTTFMFQDDDFPVGTSIGRKWVTEYCNQLAYHGLDKKVLWKINCRPDEVEEPVLKMMRDHGLFLVYMGIETGTDAGLHHMNKRSTIGQTFSAVDILKRLDICFDYGFMLFSPWTTPQLISEDLMFLRKICGDGSTPVTFCKMLPYAGTTIEQELIANGRIKGALGEEDYDFDDPSVTRVYDQLNDIFYDWVGTREGFLNMSRCMRYELAIPLLLASSQHRQMIHTLRHEAEQVIATANNFLIVVAEEILSLSVQPIEERIINTMKENVTEKHLEFTKLLEAIALRLHSTITKQSRNSD